MKSIYIVLVAFLSIHLHAQKPFYFIKERSGLDLISDVTLIGNRYYYIQKHLLNIVGPFEYDTYSDIIITNEVGQFIEEINLTETPIDYHRIFKVEGDNIILVGIVESDTCKSQLVFSRFNIKTHTLKHISITDFCDRQIMNIWITRGLHNEFFVDEYSRIGNGTKKTIFRIDSNYHLSPVLEDIFWGESVSVDFSRKGYVRAVVGLYSFYDADFNFRKQRYTEELFFTFHETHTPFGKNWILEQTVQPTSTKPERGLQIRIIDSNLVIKKKIIFFPDENLSGTMYMPFYGGIDIQNENEIWSTGEFYHGYPPTAPSYYMITKLDSNLNIICHHFLGYDTHYRLFGIRAFESGGAMIFGRRLKEGEPINEGEDIFALRVGENCELPVVAVSDPEKPMIAISAYPNPAINSLTFDVQGFDPAALRVEFITATGTVVFTRQDLRYEIRVADLPTGQYFYRILEQDKLLGVGSWVKQ